MKLQDYIHYYIGCDVLILDNERRTKLVGGDFVPNKVNDIYYSLVEEDGFIMPYNEDADTKRNRIKPILRKLESLTEDEMKECGNLVYDFSNDPYLNEWHWENFEAVLCAEQFDWLLKRGFDLFGLIDAGFAVDAKSI